MQKRQISFDLTCMQNLKQKKNQKTLIDTEDRLVVARGEEMGEGGRRVQVSS